LGGYQTPEVYATNADGKLFVRRFTSATNWASWETIGLPRASSRLTDVAASSSPGTLPFIYVLDGGRVFSRHHVEIKAYSNYSPWREISGVPANALHLCAGARSDQRQQLFVSTVDGNVYEASQTSTAPEAEFGGFQPVVQGSTPSMTDIDCGRLANGMLTVIGLSWGQVWSYSTDAPGSLGWVKEPMPESLNFRVFALGTRPAAPPTVFGVDSHKLVWLRVLGGSIDWAPLYEAK